MSTPPNSWWVELLALDTIATEITAVVTRLQGLTTLLSQQKTQLEELVQSLTFLCPVRGPHNAESLAAIDRAVNVIRGSFSVAHTSAQSFLEDQGNFVMSVLETLPSEDTERIIRSIAGLFAGLVDGISCIVAQRDHNNNASEEEIPIVLPRGLCHQRTAQICITIRHHKVSVTFMIIFVASQSL